MNHIWGLLAHPSREMYSIQQENEGIIHHYTHHVLIMAAIPVISAFIGTTMLGWKIGDENTTKVEVITAASLGVLFYLIILSGVAVMGRVIYWMARNYSHRPSLRFCTIFAGYVATPLYLSGFVALYPVVWLCTLVGAIALAYTGYLLYVGVPLFLNINRDEMIVCDSAAQFLPLDY